MEMDILSSAFLSALLVIVLIDLVLAGDNALVIGLVARHLPKDTQRKVIFWGTFAAVAVRAVMAIGVVWLLKIPGFLVVGGVALIWIARKLLDPQEGGGGDHKVAAAQTLGAAIRTVVIADAVMGIDNVLAIGGAAHGSMLLIVLGLLISVPIIVWGSQLVIRLVERWPAVVLLGGAVLAWTAYGMIVQEPLLKSWLSAHPTAKPILITAIFAISLAPWYSVHLQPKHKPLVVLLPALLLWLLAFEAAEDIWHFEVDYLEANSMRDYAIQAARWFGWLPFALAYLAWRGRVTQQTATAQR
ncbi:TerC family protein [Reyranella sp. CPCC 100927]|uniref:TerC family protein n=1 Tax=Reyranella sp. CPCC 100927 TaxID=2599616 RepID=UPI0011B4EFDA|nr:TerC family protein [Reyranella sp. CPCC 100927]TWT03861.1 TerC family protein [Reyranella sp. CPCC 100927]